MASQSAALLTGVFGDVEPEILQQAAIEAGVSLSRRDSDASIRPSTPIDEVDNEDSGGEEVRAGGGVHFGTLSLSMLLRVQVVDNTWTLCSASALNHLRNCE